MELLVVQLCIVQSFPKTYLFIIIQPILEIAVNGYLELTRSNSG
jgi:hypothetical protein